MSVMPWFVAFLSFFGAPDLAPADPCFQVPSDQACIPAGPFLRGSNVDTPAEAPMRKVFLDTYWIDKYEVTNEQYDRCVAAGVCPKKSPFRGFQEPKQPVMPATWFMAQTYCTWAGKRLPSEAEWEKAARGTSGWTWPWGYAPARCTKAHYQGCKPAVTLPVGSLPPNPYGLYDMAGNSYEWVADWFTDCYQGCAAPCGDACLGNNPKGPCDGAAECPGFKKRVLKGGSWYWPSDQARPSWRRGSVPETGGHRLGFRCAATPPGVASLHSLPNHPDVTPLPAGAADLLSSMPEDPLPAQRLQTAHYVVGNELRNDLFAPYIEGIRGALVAVGSDQGLTLAALALSELVFLFDYDSYVVHVDRIHVVFLKKATSRADFLALWGDDSRMADAEAMVSSELTKDDLKIYKEFRGQVHSFLVRNMKFGEANTRTYWLGREKDYAYIRSLAMNGRIKVLNGDLLGGETVKGIALVLQKVNMPANVLYLSNCEEYWSYYTAGFESSFEALPISEKSVVLRTFHDTKLPKAGPDHYYHYNVQTGAHLQRALKKEGLMRYRAMMEGVMKLGKKGEFSLMGFDPSAL